MWNWSEHSIASFLCGTVSSCPCYFPWFTTCICTPSCLAVCPDKLVFVVCCMFPSLVWLWTLALLSQCCPGRSNKGMLIFGYVVSSFLLVNPVFQLLYPTLFMYGISFSFLIIFLLFGCTYGEHSWVTGDR